MFNMLNSDADAEHALETSTAEVDRFVSEEAVLRISLGKGSGDGEDGAGVEKKSPAADGEPEGEKGGGAAGAAEEGNQSGVMVERLDENHLKRILGQVRLCACALLLTRKPTDLPLDFAC